jgi:hypothetical protein
MKRGRGIKGLDDKSKGMEILMTDVFAKIIPTDQVVYYESIERELKTRPIYDCRCDERLKPKDDESTCLGYTGWLERNWNT